MKDLKTIQKEARTALKRTGWEEVLDSALASAWHASREEEHERNKAVWLKIRGLLMEVIDSEEMILPSTMEIMSGVKLAEIPPEMFIELNGMRKGWEAAKKNLKIILKELPLSTPTDTER